MNLQMRLKDERRLGLSEGRNEMTVDWIYALQAQGMPQKQIVEALALAQKISLAEAQHYYDQLTQAANGGEH